MILDKDYLEKANEFLKEKGKNISYNELNEIDKQLVDNHLEWREKSNRKKQASELKGEILEDILKSIDKLYDDNETDFNSFWERKNKREKVSRSIVLLKNKLTIYNTLTLYD